MVDSPLPLYVLCAHVCDAMSPVVVIKFPRTNSYVVLGVGGGCYLTRGSLVEVNREAAFDDIAGAAEFWPLLDDERWLACELNYFA